MGSIREPLDVKNIAIIGAGPTGLAAAKFLLAEKAFDKIDIFEQQSEVGGIWNYTPSISDSVPVPQTSPHVPLDKPIWPKNGIVPIFSTPMYDQLNTNNIRDLMGFSDLSFPPNTLLFPARQDVQKYVVEYSQDIRHLISFSAQVQDVRLVPENDRDRWQVLSKSTITNDEASKIYDAVVVASGHYGVPFIPLVPGIEAFHAAYPEIITHSKIYRAPRSFAGKKVIVVGNSASGLDIGAQISNVCKNPLLNSIRSPARLKVGQDNREEVSPIAEYLIEERAVKFEDGRIEKNIDAIVYCTGYLYSYPFLESMSPPVVTTGRRVIGLYQQLFDFRHPTLAFTALSQKIIPFPVAEGQAAAIAKVWAGKLKLPSRDEMELWEKRRVEERGDGTSFHVLVFPEDAEYLNGLHDWVKTAEGGFSKEPAFWGAKNMRIREGYVEVRKKFVEGGSVATTYEELGFDFDKVNAQSPL